MSSRLCRGLILSPESTERDIVANDVVVRVYTKEECSFRSSQSTSRLVLGIHHLAGLCVDFVGGSEEEGVVSFIMVFVGSQNGLEIEGSGGCDCDASSTHKGNDGRFHFFLKKKNM